MSGGFRIVSDTLVCLVSRLLPPLGILYIGCEIGARKSTMRGTAGIPTPEFAQFGLYLK